MCFSVLNRRILLLDTGQLLYILQMKNKYIKYYRSSILYYILRCWWKSVNASILNNKQTKYRARQYYSGKKDFKIFAFLEEMDYVIFAGTLQERKS